MNKNIIESINTRLYMKLSEQIENIRKQIAISLFEKEYKGDPEVQRLAKQSSEEHEDPNEKYRQQYRKCQEEVADANPKASSKELEKLVKKCMDKN